MTPLSPLDALGPAFRRTREVLAAPFRLGFFLKIALIAALTQPSFYSASISYPLQGLNFSAASVAGGHRFMGGFTGGSPFQASPGLAAFGFIALVVMGLIGLALWILLAYLYCRLRFTLFDLVVYRRGRVREAWSRYGQPAWRYFGLVILVSLGFLILAAIIIGPALLNAVHTLRPMLGSLASLGSTGAIPAVAPNFNPLPILGAILPLILAAFALAALWAVVDALMQDFLLPPMAVEDASLESAFSRFFRLLKANFGQVVVYILLRFAVGIGITWILMLALVVVLLLGGLALFGVGTLLYHALWGSMAGQVMCVALAIVVGLFVIALYLLAILSIYGIAAVFKQAYAAYFFGGRYLELGDKLEPPPIPASSEIVLPATGPLPASDSAVATPPSFDPLGEPPPVW